jgi:hypothetical protein
VQNEKCKMQSAKWLCCARASVGGATIGIVADGPWRLVLILGRSEQCKMKSAKCKVQNGFAAPGHQLGERRLELSLMTFGG